jgi:hypothetical protein
MRRYYRTKYRLANASDQISTFTAKTPICKAAERQKLITQIKGTALRLCGFVSWRLYSLSLWTLDARKRSPIKAEELIRMELQ